MPWPWTRAGIIEGAAHGKGRGREVIAVARSADLVLMVLDGGKEQVNNHRAILERCVAEFLGGGKRGRVGQTHCVCFPSF